MIEESNFEPTNSTLQLSLALIRHGERAPIVFFHNDPNKDFWPNGHGHLTNLGKQQAFELGKQLGEIYHGFLSPKYKSEEIFVRSTDVERCIATAHGCMAGLYHKSNDGNIWDASSSYQPIPIHTTTRRKEPCMVNFEGFINLPFKTISPSCHQFIEENKELIDEVVKVSGYPNNLFLVGALLQGVQYEMRAGLPTPHGLGISPEKLNAFLSKLYHFFVSVFPAILIPTAHTMDALLGIIKEKHEGLKQKLKAYWFFTHDFMISCFLEALCDDFEKPIFVGALLFEVHKHPDTQSFYVRILFKNGLESQPREIKLRDCPSLCPIQQFSKVVKNFIDFYKL